MQPKVTPSFNDNIPNYLASLEHLKALIEGDRTFLLDTNPKLEKSLELLNELIKTLQS